MPNFESVCEHTVDKFGDKDDKKIHFINQMEFRKKSIPDGMIFTPLDVVAKIPHISRRNDHAESESVRHRVAIDLLNMTLKYMEFKDVEQRIRKLEDTITE